MTSAPMSESTIPQNGIGPMLASSTTRTPASGPAASGNDGTGLDPRRLDPRSNVEARLHERPGELRLGAEEVAVVDAVDGGARDGERHVQLRQRGDRAVLRRDDHRGGDVDV